MPKQFYGYWTTLIPSNPSSLTPTLITILLQDPSSKVRTMAANTIMAIVDGSKTFLMSADDQYNRFTWYIPNLL